ncbi:hypothetical protein SAMN05660706_106114 [Desulfoscipio geothermicus DSM 3669]|uniref:Uncharacterized protein n=1 Tax=Desulfoscipio geothermicus DSM 3669 TaxID=1121426 RepID=A0A1I6D772_9FIRM|nr:hypothetical protein SAMN05660706_106114 [Desulfoscipio geothermicus DSM 3669]
MEIVPHGELYQAAGDTLQVKLLHKGEALTGVIHLAVLFFYWFIPKVEMRGAGYFRSAT